MSSPAASARRVALIDDDSGLLTVLEHVSPGWRYVHTHFGLGYRFAAESDRAVVPAAANDRAVAPPVVPARAPAAEHEPEPQPAHQPEPVRA